MERVNLPDRTGEVLFFFSKMERNLVNASCFSLEIQVMTTVRSAKEKTEKTPKLESKGKRYS